MKKQKTRSTIAGLTGLKLKGKSFCGLPRQAHHLSRSLFNSFHKYSASFRCAQLGTDTCKDDRQMLRPKSEQGVTFNIKQLNHVKRDN
jgi:hypothetical protein